ncbi:MAG: stage III sporulation protein AD [Eubacteriales bacterium]|nr:stage III sporulation protein AD [Eubacteriales bacterium]
MEIMKIIGIALAGVLTVSLMKNTKKEFGIYIVICTVIIIFFLIADKLAIVLSFLQSLYEQISYGKTFFPILIKILAIAYMADFTAQLCKDAGESAIGNKVEFAGKVIIFYLSMPIFLSVLDLINTIL